MKAGPEHCQAPGCERSGRLSKGYCPRHYQQLYRRGRLFGPEEEYQQRDAPHCQAPGCRNPRLIARNLCVRHYQQRRRRGRFLPPKPKAEKEP